jgi:hypothetical protein
MALWSVRIGEETRSGLTVYQLQELIRSGQVPADAEASDGEAWRRIFEIPVFARSLPESTEQEASGSPKTIKLHGFELEVGEDGKPRPPPPELIAQMLASQSSQKTDSAGAKKASRVILALASIMVIVLMVLLLRLMLFRAEG